MNEISTAKRPPHPLIILSIVALVAGLLAWVWLGEWRWAVTGLLAFVVIAALGAALDGRRRGAS